MHEGLYLIGNAFLVVAALLALACVLAQALLARWWETPAGRHVMAFQSVLATVLTLWVLRVWMPDASWLIVAKLVAFAGVPVVLGWRLAIIVRVWQDRRRQHAEGTRP